KARHRLNPRGNRHPNWAIHTIAVTQLRYDTAGRRFYDRKVAEGKTTKEAQRALKRRISDVVYRHLVADAHRREQQPWGQARILTTADGFWTHAGTGNRARLDSPITFGTLGRLLPQREDGCGVPRGNAVVTDGAESLNTRQHESDGESAFPL